MAAFTVEGGPSDPGVDREDAAARLRVAALSLGVRDFGHDPVSNAYRLTIDAPTYPIAFRTVTALFRPVFGDQWWADVEAVPSHN